MVRIIGPEHCLISSAGVISSDQTAGGAAQLSSFFVTPAAAAGVAVLWCCGVVSPPPPRSTPQHRCCCSREVQQKLHFYWQHSPAPGCCWDGGGQCPVSGGFIICLLFINHTAYLLTSRAESWSEKMHNMISLGTMAYFLLHTLHLQIV